MSEQLDEPAQPAEPALRDALAKVLGRHLFLESDWPDLNHRCACGHEYDNPNASPYHSGWLHLADMVLAAGYALSTPPAPTKADQ